MACAIEPENALAFSNLIFCPDADNVIIITNKIVFIVTFLIFNSPIADYVLYLFYKA